MSDGGGKDKEQEAGTEIERVFQCHKIIYLLKIIPCSPVGTHTQTPPQPSVLSLSISIKETSLFIVSWQAERAGRVAIVCKEAQCWRRGSEMVDGGVSTGFQRRCGDLEKGRFIPPFPLRV